MDSFNFMAFIYLVCLTVGLFIAVLIIRLLYKAGALIDSFRTRNESITNAIDTLSDTLEKMGAEKNNFDLSARITFSLLS